MPHLPGKAEVIHGALIGALLFGMDGALFGLQEIFHFAGGQQRSGFFWSYAHGEGGDVILPQRNAKGHVEIQVRYEEAYNPTLGAIGAAVGLFVGLIGGAIVVAIGGVLFGDRGKTTAVLVVGSLGGIVLSTMVVGAIGTGIPVVLTFTEDGGAGLQVGPNPPASVLIGALAGGVVGLLSARGLISISVHVRPELPVHESLTLNH
jgi:hypothetical protein